MSDNKITIDLDRYAELIRKEVIYDKLMEGKDINIYLYQKVEEEKTNA